MCRSRLWIPALLALCASAGAAQTIRPVGWGSTNAPELEHGHGDKIARGRLGAVHAVFEDRGFPRFVTSPDGGVSWSAPVSLHPGPTGGGYEPALAVDSQGSIAVVFQDQGRLRYSFRAWNQSTWTERPLGPSGTQPAIVARGDQVHLVWTRGNRVEYTTFPTLSPPANPLVETIAATSCPATRFERPAIGLVLRGCPRQPVPVVGYLLALDEQGTIDPSCYRPDTVVGPVVHERVAASSWPIRFDDTRRDFSTASTVDPVAFSLSTDVRLGDVFLAYSDEQSGSARSKLAQGRGASFTSTLFEPARRHLHVRAANDGYAPAGRFRLAWVGRTGLSGSADEFLQPDAFVRAGQWSWGSIGWTDPTAHRLTSPAGGLYGGRPQAHFGERRGPGGQIAEPIALFEHTRPTGLEVVATYEPALRPAVRRALAWPDADCFDPRPARVSVGIKPPAPGNPAGTTETWVDFIETGRIVEIREDGLEIELFDPVGATVTVSWPPATSLVGAWDDGFAVAVPPEDLSFTSSEVAIELADLGEVPEVPVVEGLGEEP